MTTLSQLVDDLRTETLRADMTNTIVGYVNQTVRELHQENKSGNAIGFSSNLVELELTADLDNGFSWEIPDAHRFQSIEAIFFPERGRYATQRYPSSAREFAGTPGGNFYWYRVGTRIVFSGYGGVGSKVQVAYFQFPRRLTYFAATAGVRPAVWSDLNQAFTYNPPYNVNAASEAQGRDLTTNWMIQRWRDCVEQGTRAKVYARLSNMDRAKISYSLFESMRPGLVSAERYESGIVYTR